MAVGTNFDRVIPKGNASRRLPGGDLLRSGWDIGMSNVVEERELRYGSDVIGVKKHYAYSTTVWDLGISGFGDMGAS